MNITEKISLIEENCEMIYQKGELDERKAFWNEYLADGRPMLYAFAGYNWTDTNFNPTRNIVSPVESAERIFYVSRLTNIRDSLEKCGVTLDLSNATNLNGAFLYAATRELPALDLSGAYNVGNCFNSCSSLRSIAGIKFSQNVTNCDAAFTNCSMLEEIRIDGSICFSGLDLHWSKKLSAESLFSIISALSSEKTGLNIVLPSTAKATYDAKHGDGKWDELVLSKNNWHIRTE